MRATVTIGTTLLLLLSACGNVGNDGEATPLEEQATPPRGAATTAADPTDGGPVPEPEAQPIDTDKARAEETEPVTHPDPLVASAIADLAERRAIDAASITFVRSEESPGAMGRWAVPNRGCPTPRPLRTDLGYCSKSTEFRTGTTAAGCAPRSCARSQRNRERPDRSRNHRGSVQSSV